MALVAPPTIGNKQALSQRGEHELIDSIAAGMDSISGSNKAKRTRSVPMAASLVASSSSTSSVVSSSSSSSSSSSQIASMNPLIRTVNPGDRVNIPCSIANTGGSIQFAKDDQPIILDSGCAHCQLDISNDGQASLTINRVSHKNQGDWQCWSLDSSGKVKQKIPIVKLIVTNSPELPILIVNDKELMSGNNLDTITVKENEIINFRCVIRGATSQVDYVHWMLDSSQNITHLSQLMMEYSPQDNNYLIQSLLKLNATKSMNLKSISCLSNHQQWLTPMTVTAFLNVLYEPSFTISREPGFGVPVSEGMSVILKCEIDSNPSSNPIWVKDADNKTATIANGQMVSGKEASGEPILLDTQEDGSVILQPTKLSDSGWYRCKTENKYGNFSSFGYYLNVRPSTQSQTGIIAQTNPPQARVINNQASSLIGQQPNNAARIMAPNQSPKFNGLNGNTNTNNIINNDQPAQQQQHPFAPYQANNNQVSQDQARCRGTKIDGSPEIDRPISTINAVLGRQLTIPLRFCCNPGPARVFWIHRHLAMIPGRMFGPYITRDIYASYNSFYCYESTFEIEAVKPEDIGTVYVFVSNEKGHAGAQIHIQLAKLGSHQQQGNSNLGSSRSSLGSSGAASLAPSSWISSVFVIFSLLIVATATIRAANSRRLNSNNNNNNIIQNINSNGLNR